MSLVGLGELVRLELQGDKCTQIGKGRREKKRRGILLVEVGVDCRVE